MKEPSLAALIAITVYFDCALVSKAGSAGEEVCSIGEGGVILKTLLYQWLQEAARARLPCPFGQNVLKC
ncbi:hypothetical protein OK016_22465 [Vibrio chagasii]|nr:hypothetical protein [Vibrio chagasii]